MRVIPVIDVMGGQVVRAVGGRRSEYRPIQSRLTDSTDPAVVARYLMEAAKTNEVYIADLDAIRGGPPCAVEAVQELTDCGYDVWIDPGVHRVGDGLEYENACGSIVLATETLDGPDVVRNWFGPDEDLVRAEVSLDVSGHQLLGNWAAWGLTGPDDVEGMVTALIQLEVRTLYVIDVAAVGTASGPAAAEICQMIRHRFQAWTLNLGHILVGGGVRNRDDIRRLEDAGADGVLVASALHDETLTFPRPTW